MQQQLLLLDFGLLVFFLATIVVDHFPIFGFLCDYACERLELIIRLALPFLSLRSMIFVWEVM